MGSAKSQEGPCLLPATWSPYVPCRTLTLTLPAHAAELVAAARERAALSSARAALRCHRDPLLPAALALVRSEAVLGGRLAALARAAGDASLEKMPEFHLRVKVRESCVCWAQCAEVVGHLDAR
jgi:hypothetical protein